MAASAPPAAPAPRPPARQRAVAPAPRSFRWTRAAYFLGAVLFHLVLFMVLITVVVFRPPPVTSDDFVKTYVPPASSPPPPPATPQETVQVPAKVLSTPQPVITTSAAQTFNVPLPELTVPTTLDNATKALPTIKSANNLPSRLPSIKTMEQQNWGRSLNNILESSGDPKNVVATFPVYVAKYQDGDWDSNLQLAHRQIVAGSIPNLVDKINEWSHGNIKGTVVPDPLDIGGPELASKKPPFIFFTGHKNFRLTDQEVQNLRDYLQDGGCIWGDNALAGRGSRFDIAFRREMKRVLPDADKNFENLPVTADLFTKSWFPLSSVPQGMNYYAEPIQHIDIDGKLAVLYTPNDYSDLFFMRIGPGDDRIIKLAATPTQPLFTNPFFLKDAKVFFRNFTLEGGLGALRLGMNIVGHLLVRFDKDMLLAP